MTIDTEDNNQETTLAAGTFPEPADLDEKMREEFQNFDVLSKSFYQQYDLQAGNRGRLAPQDQSIFDQGKLTAEGANLIQNAAEVDAVLTVLGQVGQEIA